MELKKYVYGTLADGTEVMNYEMTNEKGVTLTVSQYGALITSIMVPDKNGNKADVTLGLKTLEDYGVNAVYLGATVGRHANRIGDASFSLNGALYELEVNDGKNNLHSGSDGYMFRLWDVVASGVTEDSAYVTLTLESPHMDQGFPGNVNFTLTYFLNEKSEVGLTYQATTDQDTVINPTNHSYFNLAGHDSGDVLSQVVWIDSDYVTETGEGSIPTGAFVAVEGTPMDFNTPKTLGQDIDKDFYLLTAAGGYDHNYVLKEAGEVTLVASLLDPESGRKMEVYTDLPGMQLYTGNYIANNHVIGRSGTEYIRRSGVCFETQYYPDSVHHENFPSPIFLAGETYRSTTIYKFSVEE